MTPILRAGIPVKALTGVFLFLGLCVFSTLSSAEIGKITVNDQEIPQSLFQGYYDRHFLPENICPPTSDKQIRDTAINSVLTTNRAEALGLEIDSASSMEYYEEWTEKLAQLEESGSGADAKALAKATYLKQIHHASGVYPHFPIIVEHDEIMSKYKSLIAEEDPSFTNVVTVRHTPMYFYDPANTNLAFELLQNGSTVGEVMSELPSGNHSPHYAEMWFPLYDIRKYSGDGSELETGSSVKLSDNELIYINEVKLRHRLRPGTTYRNDDYYAYDKVKWLIHHAKRKKWHRSLWEAADIREDGKPIVMAESYPVCP